jgi:hypothetical protein
MEHGTLSDQIREAVRASGLTRYAICKAIEISQPTMSRFMNSRGGLSMESMDRLGRLLGLRIARGNEAVSELDRPSSSRTGTGKQARKGSGA